MQSSRSKGAEPTFKPFGQARGAIPKSEFLWYCPFLLEMRQRENKIIKRRQTWKIVDFGMLTFELFGHHLNFLFASMA
jgi:hypothetical protein